MAKKHQNKQNNNASPNSSFDSAKCDNASNNNSSITTPNMTNNLSSSKLQQQPSTLKFNPQSLPQLTTTAETTKPSSSSPSTTTTTNKKNLPSSSSTATTSSIPNQYTASHSSIPRSLDADGLTDLLNNDNQQQFAFLETATNPLKKGWNPKRVTASTPHHITTRPSMLSIANLKHYDYTGFVNLAILVFITLTLRLIIENLLKYGFLFSFSIFKITTAEDGESLWDIIQQYMPIIAPFTLLIVYITIISPMIACFIEVFATRRTLFLRNYVEINPKNSQHNNIEKNALIGPKVAQYLHIINGLAVFFIPLFYIWNTKVLGLLLRFPIAFATVITTMKIFSYVHTSINIRTTSGQLIVIDTSLAHNIEDCQKNDKLKLNNNNNNNTSPTAATSLLPQPTSLSNITPQTAIILPHQGKQTIYEMLQDVYGNMCLFYLENMKILIHSIKYRYFQLADQQQLDEDLLLDDNEFEVDESLPNAERQKLLQEYKAQRTKKIAAAKAKRASADNGSIFNPFRWLSYIIVMPFLIVYQLFFGSDKKNRVYTIVSRSFNHFQQNKNTNGNNNTNQQSANVNNNNKQHIVGNNQQQFNNNLADDIATRVPGRQNLTPAGDFIFKVNYINEKQPAMMPLSPVNNPTATTTTSSTTNSNDEDDMVKFYIENQFTQYNTSILGFAWPSFGFNTLISPKRRGNNSTNTNNKNDKKKNFNKEENINNKEDNSLKLSQQPLYIATRKVMVLAEDGNGSIDANNNSLLVPYENLSNNNTINSANMGMLMSDETNNNTNNNDKTRKSTEITIDNLPPYPQVLPRYCIIEYAPSFCQLFYFLMSPTLIYQFSYPRTQRIKLHFVLRRIFELIFISIALIFLIEQYIKPTLNNSVRHFLEMEAKNLAIKEKFKHEVLTSLPKVVNTTKNFIETTTQNIITNNNNTNNIFIEKISSHVSGLSTIQDMLNTAIASFSSSPSGDVLTTNTGESSSFFVFVFTNFITVIKSSINIFERTLKLSFPNVIIWLLIFYGVFHSYLNLLAEITQFGDRQFYLEWWNSRDLGEYWNLWNKPVHQYFARHIFSVVLSLNISTLYAKFCVFLISAILHEVLIAIPCQLIAFHAFFGMLFQVPLIIITEHIHKKFNNPFLGNAVFWLSFCIIGQPALILQYFYQYLTSHNLLYMINEAKSINYDILHNILESTPINVPPPV